MSGMGTHIRKTVRLAVAILLLFVILVLTVGLYHTFKPLPDGIELYSREWRIPEEKVEFLYDLTYENLHGETIYEHEIFDTVFSVIENAGQYILIDMFLFNSHLGKSVKPHRYLSKELSSLLIRKKQQYPHIKIDIITDDINNVYGGAPSPELTSMREAGINVIITNHDRLRDSNPLYSSIWRTCFKWFGNSDRGGNFPHPFSVSGQKVTLRSYLTLLNFKANHRKVIVADNGEETSVLILSANCHDASSAHSNVGIMITGYAGQEVYDSENAIASLSGKQLQKVNLDAQESPNYSGEQSLSIQFLGEKAIKNEIIHQLDEIDEGDSLLMAMFYLSERDVIGSLLDAAGRGGELRIILDPTKDAFGYEKQGIPNRQVARELIDKSHGNIKIRWYNTHGEQFHSKLSLITKTDNTSSLLLGSANLTRRNICNYNLELNIKVSGSPDAACMENVRTYFERIWNNESGDQYTLEYERYKDTSIIKTIKYRVYEFAGLSTF